MDKEKTKKAIIALQKQMEKDKCFVDAIEKITDWHIISEMWSSLSWFICDMIVETYWSCVDEYVCDFVYAWYHETYSLEEAREKGIVEKSGDWEMIKDISKIKELNSYKKITDVDEFVEYLQQYR